MMGYSLLLFKIPNSASFISCLISPIIQATTKFYPEFPVFIFVYFVLILLFILKFT